jgi:hypothetical protein
MVDFHAPATQLVTNWFLSSYPTISWPIGAQIAVEVIDQRRHQLLLPTILRTKSLLLPGLEFHQVLGALLVAEQS